MKLSAYSVVSGETASGLLETIDPEVFRQMKNIGLERKQPKCLLFKEGSEVAH